MREIIGAAIFKGKKILLVKEGEEWALPGGIKEKDESHLEFLTRRINVIPVSEVMSEVSIIKSPARSALTREVDFLDVYGSIQKEEQEKEKEIEKHNNIENELLQDSE